MTDRRCHSPVLSQSEWARCGGDDAAGSRCCRQLSDGQFVVLWLLLCPKASHRDCWLSCATQTLRLPRRSLAGHPLASLAIVAGWRSQWLSSGAGLGSACCWFVWLCACNCFVLFSCPLLLAAAHEDRMLCCDLVIDAQPDGGCPLWAACEAGHAAIVSLLLAHGAAAATPPVDVVRALAFGVEWHSRAAQACSIGPSCVCEPICTCPLC